LSTCGLDRGELDFGRLGLDRPTIDSIVNTVGFLRVASSAAITVVSANFSGCRWRHLVQVMPTNQLLSKTIVSLAREVLS